MVASTCCSFGGLWKSSAEHVTRLTPFIGMGHGGILKELVVDARDSPRNTAEKMVADDIRD